jgi:hypothetical protein
MVMRAIWRTTAVTFILLKSFGACRCRLVQENFALCEAAEDERIRSIAEDALRGDVRILATKNVGPGLSYLSDSCHGHSGP